MVFGLGFESKKKKLLKQLAKSEANARKQEVILKREAKEQKEIRHIEQKIKKASVLKLSPSEKKELLLKTKKKDAASKRRAEGAKKTISLIGKGIGKTFDFIDKLDSALNEPVKKKRITKKRVSKKKKSKR